MDGDASTGLSQLYLPTEILIDIVGVHGLAGGPVSTWCHPSGLSFLKDLLPLDFPNARVMTFGYDARGAWQASKKGRSGATTARLFTFGEQLYNDLADSRALSSLSSEKVQKSRPIIFIAHGVGGIVVKQALRYKRESEITANTIHIMFFDTPHGGFDGLDLTEEAKQQFGGWSQSLSELDREFAEIGSKFPITTFYASCPENDRGAKTWAVTEASTVLGFPNERRRALDRATHTSMLQYLSAEDGNYRIVKARLEVVARRTPKNDIDAVVLVKQGKGVLARYENDHTLPLESISGYDYESTHRRLSAKRQKETTQWALSSSQFQKWLKEESSSCIWIYGKGAGKSILTSAVVDEIEARHLNPNTALVHMYCQYFNGPKESEDTPTMSAIFSSFIRQLLFRLGDLEIPCKGNPEKSLKHALRHGQRELSVTEATNIFLLLTENFSRIFYFVDGLDACETKETVEALRLFKRLFTISNRGTVHKVFLSSEHGVKVSKIIPATLKIEVSGQAVNNDIRLYVEESVKDRIIYPQLSTTLSLQQDIVEKLVEGSQGMFLWVSLQLDAICDDCNSEDDIRKALQSLPKGLDETYLRCLHRICRRPGNKKLASKLLKWVCCGKRPLYIEELKEAVAFDSSDTSWDAAKANLASSLLVNSCAGLVHLDDIENTVHLVHHSVKRFLFEYTNTAGEDMDMQLFLCSEKEANLEVGKGCMGYLSFTDFGTQVATREQASAIEGKNIPNPGDFLRVINPRLVPYTNAISRRRIHNPTSLHIRQAQSTSPASREIFARYQLLDYARSSWAFHTKHVKKRSELWPKFSHLALHPNLTWGFQPWFTSYVPFRGYCERLFDWAVHNNHFALLLTLEDVDEKGCSFRDICKLKKEKKQFPLHEAAKADHLKVFKWLSRFFDKWQLDESKENVLMCAARHGSMAVLTEMLTGMPKHSLERRSRDAPRTPLIGAVIEGRLEAASLLLRHGAPTEVEDDSGETALALAIQNQDVGAMEVLLANGALIGSDSGRKAWQYAQESSEPEIIMMALVYVGGDLAASYINQKKMESLVARSCDANMMDTLLRRLDIRNHRRWPWISLHVLLLRAIDASRIDMMEVLIDHGADYRTRAVLQQAVNSKSCEIIEFLLTRGADPTVGSNSAYPLGAAEEAFKTDQPEILRLFLRHGADVNRYSGFRGTFLSKAVEKGDIPMIKMLLDEGADVKGVFGQLRDLVAEGNIELFRMLMDHGVTTEIQDKKKLSQWLTDLVKESKIDILKMLIDHGIISQVEDKEELLHRAADAGKHEAIKLLIDAGCDVNGRKDGTSPLHRATLGGYEAAVRVLLSRNAMVNLKDHKERTALDVAKADSINALLKQHGARKGGKSLFKRSGFQASVVFLVAFPVVLWAAYLYPRIVLQGLSILLILALIVGLIVFLSVLAFFYYLKQAFPTQKKQASQGEKLQQLRERPRYTMST